MTIVAAIVHPEWVRSRRAVDAIGARGTLAQLASHNANNSPVVDGPVISLAPRHAKVRREGYRR